MPYYVFSVKPFAQYARLAEFDSFREASAHAKALRGERGAGGAGRAASAGGSEQIKVMFADTEDHAVDLMCQPREAGPAGDD